jgi:uncharacterized protein (DUF2062 family)
VGNQNPDFDRYGFFKYRTGAVITSEDEDSLRLQQELFHSDINFIIGWLFVLACLIGGIILGASSKDETVKTGGFGLAGASLGAVIQRQASKAAKVKDRNT